MVSKTREKLIDVARQLFMRKGVAHTTMDDIAAASEKGRRTIYTYFKSKREIYNTVVERESDRLVEQMRKVADDSTLSPDKQLYEFLLTRYRATADLMMGRSLLSKLNLDLKRTERIRRMTYNKEFSLLGKILDRGVAEGIFDPTQAGRLRAFMSRWLMAVDWSTNSETLPPFDTELSEEDIDKTHRTLIEFIVTGTLAKKS